MEKSTRNKLLLGAAIVLTLGVAWYGWKYWGWFGGNGLPSDLDCDSTIEENGRTYKFDRVVMSKEKGEYGKYVAQFTATEPTSQGTPVSITTRPLSTNQYDMLKDCPAAMGATGATGGAEDASSGVTRSYAAGGKVSRPKWNFGTTQSGGSGTTLLMSMNQIPFSVGQTVMVHIFGGQGGFKSDYYQSTKILKIDFNQDRQLWFMQVNIGQVPSQLSGEVY